MKKTKINYYLLAFLSALSLVSCSKEEAGVKSSKTEISVTYSLEASSDLLKFVVPVVKYTDKNGEELSVCLDADADWTTNGDGTRVWKRTINQAENSYSGAIDVRYVPVGSQENTSGKTYEFSHSATCEVSVIKSDGDDRTKTTTKSSGSVTTSSYKGDKATTFIKGLSKGSDRAFWSVDSKGNASAYQYSYSGVTSSSTDESHSDNTSSSSDDSPAKSSSGVSFGYRYLNQYLANGETIEITELELSDETRSNGASIENVKYYIDGKLIETSHSEPYAFAYQIQNFNQGKHKLGIKVQVKKDNKTRELSSTLDFYVLSKPLDIDISIKYDGKDFFKQGVAKDEVFAGEISLSAFPSPREAALKSAKYYWNFRRIPSSDESISKFSYSVTNQKGGTHIFSINYVCSTNYGDIRQVLYVPIKVKD